MKRLILFVVALLVSVQCINSKPIKKVQWDHGDTVKEIVWQGLCLIDMKQTLDFRKRGEYESNLILGRTPSPTDVISYTVVEMSSHYVISRILPNNFIRDAWQYITIGIYGETVHYNWKVSIRTKL